MLADLVLDVNVLMHADDPRQHFRLQAVDLLNAIRDSDTAVCVDGEFSIARGDNKSKIFAEYHDHLSHGGLGFTLLGHLANQGRISNVSRSVNDKVRKIVNQMVFDPTDRIYPRVANNSQEHILVSHDFAHFTENVRQQLRAKIGVEIVDCTVCLTLINPP